MTLKQCTLISTFSRACGVALMFIAAFTQSDAALYAHCGLLFVGGGLLVKQIARGEK
jgi:hypothetical protein